MGNDLNMVSWFNYKTIPPAELKLDRGLFLAKDVRETWLRFFHE